MLEAFYFRMLFTSLIVNYMKIINIQNYRDHVCIVENLQIDEQTITSVMHIKLQEANTQR